MKQATDGAEEMIASRMKGEGACGGCARWMAEALVGRWRMAEVGVVARRTQDANVAIWRRQPAGGRNKRRLEWWWMAQVKCRYYAFTENNRRGHSKTSPPLLLPTNAGNSLRLWLQHRAEHVFADDFRRDLSGQHEHFPAVAVDVELALAHDGGEALVGLQRGPDGVVRPVLFEEFPLEVRAHVGEVGGNHGMLRVML